MVLINRKTSQFITLCFVIVFGFSFSSNAQSDVLTEADEMPYFTGCSNLEPGSEKKRVCSNKNLIRFISNQLIYPETAKTEKIEGTVYVSFVVDENGNVISPKIIRDIGGGCGQAAIDIVKDMPRWEAGNHQGNAVKVKLNLPIQFHFKEEDLVEKAQTYQINWGSLTTNTVRKSDLEAQIDKALYVRDAYGNEKAVSELIFSYERRKSYHEASSTGKINAELKKIISKCKKGGTFSITAVIQITGDFVYVRQTFKLL